MQLRFVSVLNRAEPYRFREMCHFCYPISVPPSLQLGPDVCSLQQWLPYQLHPLTTQFSLPPPNFNPYLHFCVLLLTFLYLRIQAPLCP